MLCTIAIDPSNTDAAQALFYGRDHFKKGYRISDLSSPLTILLFQVYWFACASSPVSKVHFPVPLPIVGQHFFFFKFKM